MPGDGQPSAARENQGLSLTNATLGYRSGGLGASWRIVLSGVTFRLAPGEVGVLIGANGSGKTTVLRGAVGLLEPIHGSITLDGIGPRRRRIAYLPQTNAVLTWRRAIDDAALLLEIAGVPKTERQELASEALRRLHFSSGLRTRIYRLSGGERQKVALARCLAAARMVSLVAIDEPTSFLDKESREGLLKEFPGLLKAVLCPVLIATHDEGLVSALPNSRFLVEAGTLRRS